jgi:O-antigen ligase
MPVFGDFSKPLKRSLRSRRGVCSRCVRATVVVHPPLPLLLPASSASPLLPPFPTPGLVDLCLAAASGLLPESALLLLLLSFILFFSSRTPGKPAARFLYSDLRLKTFLQSRCFSFNIRPLASLICRTITAPVLTESSQSDRRLSGSNTAVLDPRDPLRDIWRAFCYAASRQLCDPLFCDRALEELVLLWRCAASPRVLVLHSSISSDTHFSPGYFACLERFFLRERACIAASCCVTAVVFTHALLAAAV